MTPAPHPWRDEESFLSFYRATVRGLWSYLYHLCGDRSAADDLVQETYLRFLKAGERIEPGDGLTGYLYRTGYRLFVDQYRRRKVDRVLVPASRSSEATAAAQIEAGTEAAMLLDKAGSRDRLLLWLAYGEGLDHTEIAGRLGVGAKSIRVMLFRARRRLLGILGRKGQS